MNKPTLRIGKLSEFAPAKQNANRHTPRGMALLEDAMTQVGYVAPMTATADGEVIDGSARLEKSALVFSDDVIVVEHDGDVPIVMKRRDIPTATDDRAKVIAVGANRIGQLNLDLDPVILQQQHIPLGAFWTDEEFKQELAKVHLAPQGDSAPLEDVEIPPDRAEELQKKWQCESGQLWQLGNHRLLCGDATKREDVERLMGAEKAVLCHADPPYGMGKEAEGVDNDNLYGAKLDAFQMAWWKAVRPSLVDNASVYIWGNAEDLWRLWYVGGLQASERLTLRNEIVWAKTSGQGITAEDFRSYPPVSERCLFFMLGEQGFNTNADNYWEGWEPIQKYLYEQRQLMGWTSHQMKQFAGGSPNGHGDHWTGKSQWMMPTRANYEGWQRAAKNDAFKRDYDDLKRDYDDLKRDWYATRAYFDNTHDNMTDVWSFQRVTGEERWDHATPKPVPMIVRAIKSSAPEGGLVIEPFSGSGTTIMACEQTARVCRALEIDASSVAVALERFCQATGKTPTLL